MRALIFVVWITPSDLKHNMETGSSDSAAIQDVLASSGNEILTAVCGLSLEALNSDASGLTPQTSTEAYLALCRALDDNVQPLDDTASSHLLQLRSAHERAPRAANVVSLAPLVQHIMLLSSSPSNFISGYLEALWQYDVEVAVSLCPVTFWPEQGATVTYNEIEVHTNELQSIPVAGLRAPILQRTCRLSHAGLSRPLKVMHILWPDFGALPGATLASVVAHVEAVREGRAMAVHCAAGLGRSGTFALAHAVLAAQVPRSTSEVLLGFLSLRLQRRGTIETEQQFYSIVDALRSRREQSGISHT